MRESEMTWFLGLCLVTVLIGAGAAETQPAVPLSSFVVPTLIGGLVLSVRRLLWLLPLVAVCLVGSAALVGFTTVRVGSVVVIVVVAGLMMWNAQSRSKLGVAGSRGESMLIDLRDRLLNQSELPELPRTWYAEAVMRSAGGASFAGDFMVAAKTHANGRVLEVAVVDVSGKGMAAGTRALLLSGAFGGLLGALPPERFLPAANDYLLRQEWGEGFATAVHLAIDLSTGDFEVRTAGHPPVVQFHSGSGRWAVHDSEGPVLGLMDAAEFSASSGRLLVGDALLLYTDGLVETPQRDITMGIDKLVGEAERLVRGGFDGGATRLVDRIASENDDRALLLLHRR
ncbi:MAG TPA: PP2C family protein-serine/threonine phosphatase [Nocardioidaceae bacterium]|nr:PP2C family protein-serine/threonine phosphatase [Nocardioidaceae bacterium]